MVNATIICNGSGTHILVTRLYTRAAATGNVIGEPGDTGNVVSGNTVEFSMPLIETAPAMAAAANQSQESRGSNAKPASDELLTTLDAAADTNIAVSNMHDNRVIEDTLQFADREFMES